MPHSGTTCLAQALINGGLRYAPVLRRGTLEDNEIVSLHVSMIHWKDPKKASYGSVERKKRDEIVARYGSGDWGFKDPMTMWATDLWLEVLPLKLLGIYSHPRYVVGYLSGMFRVEQNLAEKLWCQWNERLLELHEEHKFPIIAFDTDDASLERALSYAVSHVGLDHTKTLWNPAMRTRPYEAKDYVMSREAEQIYACLRSHTVMVEE